MINKKTIKTIHSQDDNMAEGSMLTSMTVIAMLFFNLAYLSHIFHNRV